MIIYADTSAVVKLYVTETHSEKIRTVMDSADLTASHILTYVEAHSAFARLHRSNHMTDTQLTQAQNAFNGEWPGITHIELNNELVRRAGNAVAAFQLRAYDAVHLMAAEMLQDHVDDDVTFACFDRRLNQAAVALGMGTLEIN